MNSRLGKYRSEKTYHSKDGLPALAFVKAPKTLSSTQNVFVVTDKVRTTLHLAWCRKIASSNSYALRTPLRFARSHDMFTWCFKWVCKEKTPIDVYEVLLHVGAAPAQSDSTFSKKGCTYTCYFLFKRYQLRIRELIYIYIIYIYFLFIYTMGWLVVEFVQFNPTSLF